VEQIVIFFLSLLGLWLGADFITKGALGLAHRFGLSEGFIGMTLLALGTSFPEIMISLAAAREQAAGIPTSGIVIGNVIGANMSLMALVLGAVGLLGVIKVSHKRMRIEGSALILSTTLLLLFASDGVINRFEGMIFLAAYLLYLIFLNRTRKEGIKVKGKMQSLLKSLFLLGLGLLVISQASQYVIDSGISIAASLGVDQIVVGALLLGVGTTLPEFTIAIRLALKHDSELSIGNLVGSNVVDILLVLGLGAMITDWHVASRVVQFDLPFLLLSMMVAALFMLSRGKLERRESLLLLSLYGIYIALKLMGW
jgi:cation:H+ antiporter